MFKSHDERILSVFCIFLIFSAVGCDQISSLKDSVIKPKKESASAVKAAAPAKSTKKSNEIKNFPANTLARVGEWYITTDQFKERLNALKEVIPDYDIKDLESRKLVLEELVNQQVLVGEAERTGLSEQKDIIAAVEEFRRTLIVREVARKLTESIVVSDSEAKAFYNEKKDLLVKPFKWKVSEIVASTQKEANDILIELLQGGIFAEVAKVKSKGKTAAQGGDLGYLEREPFPQMVNALLALNQGENSNVFKGPEGFYIIRLDEKSGGEQVPFAEVKEDIIKNQTIVKQQESILNHINSLKQRMTIKVFENLL